MSYMRVLPLKEVYNMGPKQDNPLRDKNKKSVYAFGIVEKTVAVLAAIASGYLLIKRFYR